MIFIIARNYAGAQRFAVERLGFSPSDPRWKAVSNRARMLGYTHHSSVVMFVEGYTQHEQIRGCTSRLRDFREFCRSRGFLMFGE